MKTIGLVFLLTVLADAAMITGGSVEYDFGTAYPLESQGYTSIIVDDGISFAGPGNVDNGSDAGGYRSSECFRGVYPCTLFPTGSANLDQTQAHSDPALSGYLTLSLPGITLTTPQTSTETFFVPFTATGFLYGSYMAQSAAFLCDLPGNTYIGGCVEPISGSGIAQIEIGYISVGSYSNFIEDEKFTFAPSSAALIAASVPEPESWTLFCVAFFVLTIVRLFALCARRHCQNC